MRLINRKLFAFLFLISASLPFASTAADWPHWRGPDDDRISRETDWLGAWPAEGPKQIWKASLGYGLSSFSIAKGLLFTMGNVTREGTTNHEDTVWCLAADTGKVRWKYSYPARRGATQYQGGPTSTPTIDGNNVYSLSREGDLFCFEAKTGKIVWQQHLGRKGAGPLKAWGYASSPCIDDERLILNIGDAGTILDKKTGQTIRAGATNIWGFSTPRFFTQQGKRRMLLFQFPLVCIDPDSGKQIWNHSFNTSYMHVMDPVISNDLVFVSSYDWKSAVLRLNGDNPPEVVWHNDNLVAVLNTPVLIDGFLYGIHGHGEKNEEVDLRCVQLATGDVKWRFKGLGFGSVIAADNKLIVLGGQGELAILEATPSAAQVLARAQVLGGKCWATPVLSNGRLFCRNGAGETVCLALK